MATKLGNYVYTLPGNDVAVVDEDVLNEELAKRKIDVDKIISVNLMDNSRHLLITFKY